MTPIDPFSARSAALAAAAVLHADRYARGNDVDETVLGTANRLTAWLLGPASIWLLLGPVTDQITGTTQPHEGNPIMAELKDTQKAVVTVEAKDSKGFDVADTFTFSSSDESVISLVAGDGGLSVTVVAGNPGSAVLTATDGDGRTGTLAFDVTTGDIASVVMTAADPTNQ